MFDSKECALRWKNECDMFVLKSMQNNPSSILAYFFKKYTALIFACSRMHQKTLEEYAPNSAYVSKVTLHCFCNIYILNWTYVTFVIGKTVF